MQSMQRSERMSALAAAEEAPDAVAIVSEAGTLTFGDIAPRVRRVMRWLASRPDAEHGIAVVATLRVDTIVLFYAAVALGVPIYVLHPRLTGSERAALVAMCGGPPVIDEAWSEGATPEPPRDAQVEARVVPDDALLAVLFTSGSSGASKGVALTRGAFRAAALASAKNLGWREDDRWLLCMPLGHVGGLSVVLRCLLARRPVVLAAWTGDVKRLLVEVETHRVTILSLVPTMLRRILDEGPARPFSSHVRVVLLGGDAAPGALLEEAERRGVPTVTTYGLTEACSQVATQRPTERPSASAGVGHPVPGAEVRIVDGQIHVRGPMLMRGYFPEGRWPSPFVEGGWLVTGDLGEIDAEGRLHVRGRRSDMIITGGENVDPIEVEAALARCAGVSAVCVFGVPDDRWGQIVGAAIVPSELGGSPVEAVQAFAAEHLAAHKRPRRVLVLDALPLNGTGKVDRKRAASLCLEAEGHQRIK